ncbi:MAG: DSD1 family PLP-dependent enzyme [Pseudomonadaceae bacterium]|nr:DSD1 family PLP-dependent enzyme [Pseudomonadaceae bacterium]
MSASNPMIWQSMLDELLARPTEPEPAPAGLTLADLPTPALLIDEAVMERNLARMAAHLRDHGKGARPHSKTHKCPPLAKRQIELGAIGICCAKPSEALVQGYAGVGSILVTSAVLDAGKLRLLAQMVAKRGVDLAVVVDSELGLSRLAEAAGEAGAELGVVIDLDVAMGRTGTRDDKLMLALARVAEEHPSLRYEGIQHYAGHVQHIADFAERRDASLSLWETVSKRLDLLDAEGLTPRVVTGAGTGTFDIDVGVTRLTDLQVGSYAVMDQEYRIIGGATTEQFEAFEPALTVLCSVISEPTSKTVTVDGGYKSFASDSVAPEPCSLAGARFVFGGDEHGILIPAKGSQEPLLGERLQFIAPHCDPTINLYDYAWLHRNGEVLSRWPIAARGCSW